MKQPIILVCRAPLSSREAARLRKLVRSIDSRADVLPGWHHPGWQPAWVIGPWSAAGEIRAAVARECTHTAYDDLGEPVARVEAR